MTSRPAGVDLKNLGLSWMWWVIGRTGLDTAASTYRILVPVAESESTQKVDAISR